MSVETIVNRILEEARDKSKKNELDAKKTADNIVAEAKREGAAFIKAALSDGEKKLGQLKKQRMAAANLAARDLVIRCKQEIIDKSFKRAQEIINNIKGDEYVGLLAKMVADKAKGGEDVILGPGENNEGQSIINRANKILSERGAKPTTLARDSRNFGRGFILRWGKIEENFVFSRLIETAREEIEADVAAIIFGEQK